MGEGARYGVRVGMERFNEIFDDEAVASEATDEVFEAVQELECAGLAMLESFDLRERFGGVVGNVGGVGAAGWLGGGLETGGLFMLADVESAGANDAGDVSIDGDAVGDVAGADGLGDEIEGSWGEWGEIIDGGFDGANVEVALGGDLTVEGEHGGTDVDDRDARAGGGEERGLATPAGTEAEDLAPGDVGSHPTAGIEFGEGVLELVIAGRRGEPLAGVGHAVPGAAVVGVDVVHRQIVTRSGVVGA